MKDKIIIAAVISVFVSFFLLVILLVHPVKQQEQAEETKIIEEEYVGGAGENEPLEPVIEGDSGEDGDWIMTIDSTFQVDASMGTRKSMVELIFEYSGYIPFADGQHYYGKGYFKSPDGIDNLARETPVGMDSLGYIIWVYRNTFGYCDPLFNDPITYYQKSQKISAAELQVGDIGMYTDKNGEKNHFGICIGYDHAIPVFSHCSNLVAPKYPCGNDRLSFLRSAADSYYMGNAPVEFNFFFRPDVPWKEGGLK